MKKLSFTFVLSWFIAFHGLSGANSVKYFPDDMAVIIYHRGHTSLAKKATIVHDGFRYHIFSGGIGSTIRIYTAFIYRETPKGLVLAYFHPKYQNHTVPGIGIIPDITEKSIILSYASKQGPIKLKEISFEDLKQKTEAEPVLPANPL